MLGNLTVQRVVQERNISCLVHFTRLSNLNKILTEGLRPRKDLEKEECCFFSDSLRLDGHPECIALSVSFPNYRMLYSLRCANPEEKWVFLLLQPSILWEKSCAFYRTNAANRIYSSIDIDNRKGVRSFLEMFEEQEKTFVANNEVISAKVREYFKFPNRYTTDPQAEVLCCEPIEVGYIVKIFFKTDSDKQSINIPNDIYAKTEPAAFYYRQDYLAWK